MHNMAKTTEDSNKALVLEAFDTLFNKRDYKAAERYWSSNYIQHIAPGRDGLFNLVRSTPPALKYEPGLVVAEKDLLCLSEPQCLIVSPTQAAQRVRSQKTVLASHPVSALGGRGQAGKRSPNIGKPLADSALVASS
jgi:hypothetical protein